MNKVKKRTMGVALFLGTGAAALGVGAGTASADEGVPAEVTVQPEATVSQRIVNAAWEQYREQNPGTYYSGGQYQAWCANFVSWVLNNAGTPLHSPNGGWRVPAVQTLNGIFSSQGKLERPGSYMPKPGDVVLFGNNHTSLVAESDPSTGTITTIGGNESNKVSVQRLSATGSGITGYGRVADDTPPPAPEAVPVVNDVPAPDPFAPPAPETVPVMNEAPAPYPFAPPAPEATTVVNADIAPPPPPVDMFAPPAPEATPLVNPDSAPPVDMFAPPAPEVVPVLNEVPPPSPAPEIVPAMNDVPPPPPVDAPLPAPEIVPVEVNVPVVDAPFNGPV